MLSFSCSGTLEPAGHIITVVCITLDCVDVCAANVQSMSSVIRLVIVVSASFCLQDVSTI